MQITKVQYGKTYSLGNYCSERIDLEATIDNETTEEAIQALRNQCDTIHKKNNPHLYQEQQSQYVKTSPDFEAKTGIPFVYTNSPQTFESQPVTEEKISPEQEIANTIAEIEAATPETLHTFQLQAAKSNKTMGAYNRRKKQLNIT